MYTIPQIIINLLTDNPIYTYEHISKQKIEGNCARFYRY